MAQEWSTDIRWWMAMATLVLSMVTERRPCVTEARLSKVSMEMLADIGKNTVDFTPNFDETEKEPVVLPPDSPIFWSTEHQESR